MCLAQQFLFALLVGACTIFIFIGVCRFRPTNTSNFRSGPVWQPCLDLVTTCSNFRPTFFFMLRIYVRALLFCFYFISFVSSFFFQGWLQGKQDTKNTMNLVERAQEAWVSRYLIFKVCSPEKSMIRSWPARISVLFNETCPLEYGAVLVIFFRENKESGRFNLWPCCMRKKVFCFFVVWGVGWKGREGKGRGGGLSFFKKKS